MMKSILVCFGFCMVLAACGDEDEPTKDMTDMTVDLASDMAMDQGMDMSSDMLSDMAMDQPEEMSKKMLGEGCSMDGDCGSGHCVTTFVGDICGECATEQDCQWGCNPPVMRGLSDVSPSTCNQGQLGDRCETDAGCQVGTCGKNPLTLPFEPATLKTCNGCQSDADCETDQRCDIKVGQDTLMYYACVPVGGTPDGGICDDTASGDEACSNVCAIAKISGPVELAVGVCSPCDENTPCPDGKTCQPPLINPMMAQMPTPGSCQ